MYVGYMNEALLYIFGFSDKLISLVILLMGFFLLLAAVQWLWNNLLSPPAGTSYNQQSYKVSDVFPFKWITKKWKEGFFVTSMTTAGSRWGIVMSRNAGFSSQVGHFPKFYAVILEECCRKHLTRPCFFRLLNLISCIQVKGSTKDGRVDIELHQLLQHQIKLHSYSVHAREELKMWRKKLSAHLLFLAHMLRWV